MTILDIKEGIRHHLTMLADAAVRGDRVTAGEHFAEIMLLTDKLGGFHDPK